MESNLVVKLIDFSHAIKADEIQKTSCGTEQYMAPEILSNDSYVPKYVDIFALGVCLFYIVTK